ncbi:MAG: hypothetical protein MUF18_00505 [Fimbriiglobus sp.]|jgi:hypothetical protein|nr:hypothetical protein [Fimbriiglobus sp.]
MATLTEQLDAMLTLKGNWDGYNADPIVPEVVEVAKEFVGVLKALLGRREDESGMFVAPGRDGGVLVEWADDTAEYEMEINPDGSFGFLREDKVTGEMTTERFQSGRFAVPVGILRRFRQLAA